MRARGRAGRRGPGLSVILATDALCSSSEAAHAALLSMVRQRYHQQVEIAAVEEILRAWP